MTGAIEYKAGRGRHFLPPLLLLATVLGLVFSHRISAGVQNALSLCARVILPTLFPFMVLSELLGEALADMGRGKKGKGFFERAFSVDRVGMSGFLLGALCGFPLGVKHARTLYDRGLIEENSCVRLVCFSNNTGPAFVVAGVGGGLFGSFRLGVWLYGIQIFSALIVGMLFARFPLQSGRMKRKSAVAQGGGLVAAIRKSVASAAYVCGMVCFFSAVCALFASFCKNSDLLLFIYPFLEVGGACSLAAEYAVSAHFTAIFAALMAICFGGASVHMQAVLFFEDGGFPLLRYLAAKVVQCLFAALFFFLCFPFL